MQVVRYDVGQSYHSHYDYFDPKRYPDREDLQRGRQRMITVRCAVAVGASVRTVDPA